MAIEPPLQDLFLLVGPQSNPAELQDGEDISTMLNKLVTTGNHDVTVNEKSILSLISDQASYF
jgi:hypothetical protein